MSVVLDPGAGGAEIASDTIGSLEHQFAKLEFGGTGVATQVSSSVPLPVQGTVTAPVYIAGSVSITGITPVSGSVSIIGGTVGAVVGGGSLNVSAQGGSLEITGGSVHVQGTVTITGTVLTTTTVTMGTVPDLLAGSVNVSNQGGSVGVSGGSIAVGGTVTIIGGSIAVGGTVSILAGSVNVRNAGGSVAISDGSVNVRNQGGSLEVSAILGTLPGFNRNALFNVAAGVTGTVMGTLSLTQAQGTGDYLSHLTVMAGSTDANQVILIDGTTSLYNQTVCVSVPGPGKGTYTVAVQAYSRFGPWKLTTGGGATVMATGIFTF